MLGIPDLRVYEDPLIPLDDDLLKAKKLEVQAAHLSFAELVKFYWSLPTYPPTSQVMKDRFVRHVLTDTERVKGYIDAVGKGGAFLEIGCGTAALVAAAAPMFSIAIGCDVAFRWLIVARKRLQEAGVTPLLVCCCADNLPFPEGYFQSVASVALLEHVFDAQRVLQEQALVARPGGIVFASTTNRFSLAYEPHVGLWGVGFLPRSLMPAYVRWRRDADYRQRLLSAGELHTLLRNAQFEHVMLRVPNIANVDIARFRVFGKLVIRTFRIVTRIPILSSLLVLIFPVLEATAERSSHIDGHD